MKLVGYAVLTSKMRLRSGLHIGTGEEVGKGEPIPVIKSVVSNLPYIPGSSLKGKMRHLLEVLTGKFVEDNRGAGKPCNCGKCSICLLFGSGEARTTFEPTRLVFRDTYPTPESQQTLEKLGVETKPGVAIDRKTGKALSGALFPSERVPEGTDFAVEVSCRIFDVDDREAIRKWLSAGLYLIEQDALGGGGTRGSGQVEFRDTVFDGKEFADGWRDEIKTALPNLLEIPVRK